jgi:hypothetical protein
VNNYRVLRIKSLPAGYYDADTRLFFGAFDLLVEFCEVELAWLAMSDEDVKVPWWQTKNQYRKTHAEQLVMKYFKWSEEFKEKLDGQVYRHPKLDSHKELKDLYVWFKHTRPNRPDPTEFWSKNRKTDSQAFQKSQIMENAQEDEDTENFVRLVKSRSALWT